LTYLSQNHYDAKLYSLSEIQGYILSCQDEDGAIYWQEGEKLDPWDHTEAAMALSICGNTGAARKAFNWLRGKQLANGSWYARYDRGVQNHNDQWKVETNFVAYPITGIWHHFLITRDVAFLNDYFPMVKAAANYILSQQRPEGDIQWALSEKETLPKDALVAACSSILRSLECAIRIAEQLNQRCVEWRNAYRRLADALLNRPWRFARTWESKSRYSMDWFYPILAGIYTPEEARIRIEKQWSNFVAQDLGCRCVSDEPWVTTAESCELVIALISCGRKEKALELFKWLSQWKDKDQGYWTGYNFRDKVIWPEEKTSWTAAAIALAADALFDLSPASTLFTRRSRII